MQGVPQAILLFESDENELVFMTIALEQAEIASNVHVVKSSEQAIAYLSANGEFSDRTRYPLPRLALLDLDLPGRAGIDVLRWIREQPQLDAMVVIALFEREQRDDVGLACSLGANSCLVKPSPRIGLCEMMALVRDYWLHLNQPSAGI